MEDFLTRLRRKPERVRRRILFVVLGVSLFLIGGGWFFMLPERFEAHGSRDVSPLQGLDARFSRGWKEVRESLTSFSREVGVLTATGTEATSTAPSFASSSSVRMATTSPESAATTSASSSPVELRVAAPRQSTTTTP